MTILLQEMYRKYKTRGTDDFTDCVEGQSRESEVETKKIRRDCE
jgi:hypothetical protein